MAAKCHLVTFTSAQFDASAETANPINPIAGESVLQWLREGLRSAGYEVTVPQPEDWGWYVYVNGPSGSYLVGASSDLDQAIPREWIIQIHRQRSLTDKLLGRHKLTEDDALSSSIEVMIRENDGIQNVEVDRSA